MANEKKRDELVFLEDILECIEKIEEYVEGLTEKEFEENSEKQDAVIRRIEIIGEAVKVTTNNCAFPLYRTDKQAGIPPFPTPKPCKMPQSQISKTQCLETRAKWDAGRSLDDPEN